MSDTSALIRQLRSIEEPEALFPLAANASAQLATAENPGGLLVVHVAVLAIAHQLEGEAVTTSDWTEITRLLDQLAVFLESPDAATLDAVGQAWRDWKNPDALH